MTINVAYNSFMDFVLNSKTRYLADYDHLPEKAKNKLNQWFDGKDLTFEDVDNIWANL